eukprot:scaffold95395_cov19-Tisochrysis_lutea.AAC.2
MPGMCIAMQNGKEGGITDSRVSGAAKMPSSASARGGAAQGSSQEGTSSPAGSQASGSVWVWVMQGSLQEGISPAAGSQRGHVLSALVSACPISGRDKKMDAAAVEGKGVVEACRKGIVVSKVSLLCSWQNTLAGHCTV